MSLVAEDLFSCEEGGDSELTYHGILQIIYISMSNRQINKLLSHYIIIKITQL